MINALKYRPSPLFTKGVAVCTYTVLKQGQIVAKLFEAKR